MEFFKFKNGNRKNYEEFLIKKMRGHEIMCFVLLKKKLEIYFFLVVQKVNKVYGHMPNAYFHI
jgi:hypothetical protein